MGKHRKPLTVRARLERALARYVYFSDTAPSVEWLRKTAPLERREWSESKKQLGGWMVDERGVPYPMYVVSLGHYVDALGRAFESERDTIAAFLAEKSTEAGAAFKKLVDAGANPVWIAAQLPVLKIPHETLLIRPGAFLERLVHRSCAMHKPPLCQWYTGSNRQGNWCVHKPKGG